MALRCVATPNKQSSKPDSHVCALAEPNHPPCMSVVDNTHMWRAHAHAGLLWLVMCCAYLSVSGIVFYTGCVVLSSTHTRCVLLALMCCTPTATRLLLSRSDHSRSKHAAVVTAWLLLELVASHSLGLPALLLFQTTQTHTHTTVACQLWTPSLNSQ